MATFERLGVFTSCPRTPSTLGWFNGYDANILGGMMVGVGMTLTGACPGTVLVQLSTGIRSGFFVMIGGILGGILYSRFGRYLRNNNNNNSAASSESPTANLTVHSKLGLDPNRVLLAYEAACVAIITLATYLAPQDVRAQLHPVVGGLLIGGAQAASIIMTSKPVGVSTVYEEIGQYFWRTWDRAVASSPPSIKNEALPSTRAIQFALGILAGSWTLARSVALTQDGPGSGSGFRDVSNFAAVLGGCVMVFGARLAGGCTSGHGISGMAMLSVSSIVTVAAMFGGGIALAALMK